MAPGLGTISGHKQLFQGHNFVSTDCCVAHDNETSVRREKVGESTGRAGFLSLGVEPGILSVLSVPMSITLPVGNQAYCCRKSSNPGSTSCAGSKRAILTAAAGSTIVLANTANESNFCIIVRVGVCKLEVWVKIKRCSPQKKRSWANTAAI